MRHRDTTYELLHPLFRNRLIALMSDLKDANLPFGVFETYRPPERQLYLYRKGRPIGRKVTSAKPWQSKHQYGIAADIVLRDPDWSWRAGHEWAAMHTLALKNGLEYLRVWDRKRNKWKVIESPHIQLPDGPEGLFYDEVWYENLLAAASRYPKGAPRWLMPLVEHVDRPYTGELNV